MPVPIRIVIDETTFSAELDDTPAATRVLESLPVESDYATWGDEIYFSIPVSLKSETMAESVDIGDIAYWPPGGAFCIFFGLTPLSSPGDIRPASPVIPLGRLTGDFTDFKALAQAGSNIRVEFA